MLSQAEQKAIYPITLLLSNNLKNFESIGRFAQTSGDSIERIIDNKVTNSDELIALTKVVFRANKKLYLLADDSLIEKIYSRFIEGSSDHYDTKTGQVQRALCSVVVMLTDGKTAIAVEHEIWTSRDVNPIQYQTKSELVKKILLRLQDKIKFNVLVMDGLYATRAMMDFCQKFSVPFEMRFHANRVVEINGFRAPINKGNFFKLSGRRTAQTKLGYWYGMQLYFTAHRRRLATGEYTIIYQVSNYKASSRNHVTIYGYRWNIEKFFRTAKQKLGFKECQSRKLERQKKHIMNVFLAYAYAQIVRIKNKLKNVEMAIKLIKTQYFDNPRSLIEPFRQIFRYV